MDTQEWTNARNHRMTVREKAICEYAERVMMSFVDELNYTLTQYRYTKHGDEARLPEKELGDFVRSIKSTIRDLEGEAKGMVNRKQVNGLIHLIMNYEIG